MKRMNPGVLVPIVARRLDDGGEAACARAALMYLGLDVKQKNLGRYVNGDHRSMAKVIDNFAFANGVESRSVPYERLGASDLSAHILEQNPAIVRLDNGRCVVACAFDENGVVVMDPWLEAYVPIEWSEFKRRRDKAGVVVVKYDRMAANPSRNMDERRRQAERALRASPNSDTVRQFVREAVRGGTPELEAYDEALAIATGGNLAPGDRARWLGMTALVNDVAFADQPESARNRWHGRLMLMSETPPLGQDDQTGDRRLSLWAPDDRALIELLPAGDVYVYAADRLGDAGIVRAIVRDENATWSYEYLEGELRSLVNASDATIAASWCAMEASAADMAPDDEPSIPPERWSGWFMTRLADAVDRFLRGSSAVERPPESEIVFDALALGQNAVVDDIQDVLEDSGEGYDVGMTVLSAFEYVMRRISDHTGVGRNFVLARGVSPKTLPGRPTGSNSPGQPQWREAGRVGDVNMLEYDGGIVFVDETGAYPPELELVRREGRRIRVYRVILEPHTYINGVLSDNRFHPDNPTWYADRINDVANTVGRDPIDLIDALRGDDVMAKARAYEDLIGYFGIENFDSDPLVLSLAEARARYPDA